MMMMVMMMTMMVMMVMMDDDVDDEDGDRVGDDGGCRHEPSPHTPITSLSQCNGFLPRSHSDTDP